MFPSSMTYCDDCAGKPAPSDVVVLLESNIDSGIKIESHVSTLSCLSFKIPGRDLKTVH